MLVVDELGGFNGCMAPPGANANLCSLWEMGSSRLVAWQDCRRSEANGLVVNWKDTVGNHYLNRVNTIWRLR